MKQLKLSENNRHLIFIFAVLSKPRPAGFFARRFLARRQSKSFARPYTKLSLLKLFDFFKDRKFPPRFSHSILTAPDETARNAAARIARRRTILPAKAFCPRREKGSERKIKCPRKAYLPFIGQPAAEEISNWGRNFISRAPSEIAHFRRCFPRAARGSKKFAMPPANCSARQKFMESKARFSCCNNASVRRGRATFH